MWTAEVVLVCALNLLGRSLASFPPIELVSSIPAGVSPNAEAYVRQNDQRIYLVTTSATFREGRESRDRCSDLRAVRKLASVLIHEEAHLRQGADEKTAYQAQLTMLSALGSGPGSPSYQAVMRAMRQTLDQERRTRARLMASALP